MRNGLLLLRNRVAIAEDRTRAPAVRRHRGLVLSRENVRGARITRVRSDTSAGDGSSRDGEERAGVRRCAMSSARVPRKRASTDRRMRPCRADLASERVGRIVRARTDGFKFSARRAARRTRLASRRLGLAPPLSLVAPEPGLFLLRLHGGRAFGPDVFALGRTERHLEISRRSRETPRGDACDARARRSGRSRAASCFVTARGPRLDLGRADRRGDGIGSRFGFNGRILRITRRSCPMSVVASSFPVKNAVDQRSAARLAGTRMSSSYRSSHRRRFSSRKRPRGRARHRSTDTALRADRVLRDVPAGPVSQLQDASHQRRHRARRALGRDRPKSSGPTSSTSPTRTRRRARSAPWACARAPAGAGPPPGTRSATAATHHGVRARARTARRLAAASEAPRRKNTRRLGRRRRPPHAGTRAFERARSNASSLPPRSRHSFVLNLKPFFVASFRRPRRVVRHPLLLRRRDVALFLVRASPVGPTNAKRSRRLPTSRTVRGTRRAASSRATRSSAWTFSRPRPRPDAARRCSGSRRSLRKPSL